MVRAVTIWTAAALCRFAEAVEPFGGCRVAAWERSRPPRRVAPLLPQSARGLAHSKSPQLRAWPRLNYEIGRKIRVINAPSSASWCCVIRA